MQVENSTTTAERGRLHAVAKLQGLKGFKSSSVSRVTIPILIIYTDTTLTGELQGLFSSAGPKCTKMHRTQRYISKIFWGNPHANQTSILGSDYTAHRSHPPHSEPLASPLATGEEKSDNNQRAHFTLPSKFSATLQYPVLKSVDCYVRGRLN